MGGSALARARKAGVVWRSVSLPLAEWTRKPNPRQTHVPGPLLSSARRDHRTAESGSAGDGFSLLEGAPASDLCSNRRSGTRKPTPMMEKGIPLLR